MFTYTDIIALTIGGFLLLVFIIKVKGNIDGGPIGVLMLSSISLIFFTPAIIYALNLPASAHDLESLVKNCPDVRDEVDFLGPNLKSRKLTALFNQCRGEISQPTKAILDSEKKV